MTTLGLPRAIYEIAKELEGNGIASFESRCEDIDWDEIRHFQFEHESHGGISVRIDYDTGGFLQGLYLKCKPSELDKESDCSHHNSATPEEFLESIVYEKEPSKNFILQKERRAKEREASGALYEDIDFGLLSQTRRTKPIYKDLERVMTEYIINLDCWIPVIQTKRRIRFPRALNAEPTNQYALHLYRRVEEMGGVSADFSRDSLIPNAFTREMFELLGRYLDKKNLLN